MKLSKGFMLSLGGFAAGIALISLSWVSTSLGHFQLASIASTISLIPTSAAVINFYFTLK